MATVGGDPAAPAAPQPEGEVGAAAASSDDTCGGAAAAAAGPAAAPAGGAIVQYVVVRKDLTKSLGWGPGPVMAQVAIGKTAILMTPPFYPY